jgi:hypothetical protein
MGVSEMKAAYEDATQAINRLCGPDRTTKPEAIAFLQMLASHLDDAIEALREAMARDD